MKTINVKTVTETVKKLFIEANYILPDDVRKKIDNALADEDQPLALNNLSIIKENYEKAEKMIYPLCQDTGMAVVFLEIGQEIHFTGGLLIEAVNEGVKAAYQEGYLRKSIVQDPLNRKNTGTNLPAVIHSEITAGDVLKISVMPKGFGSENQSALKMLLPYSGREAVIDFVVRGVTASGGKGCPPCVLGVGIGGNFEYTAYLSKKALLNPLTAEHPDPYYREMAAEILGRINQSRVGSMGLGGKITCLGVNILTYPTHIAGLPVAYSYSCHSCRHQTAVL